MKNVTVTMADDALEWVRVKAARENESVSRYLGQLVEEARKRDTAYEKSMRAALKFSPLALPQEARYLTRDEVHSRADLR
jgi:predicted CopG family antitoxin